MSLVCASIARLPWLALDRGINEAGELPKGFARFRLWLGDVRFDRKETALFAFAGRPKVAILEKLETCHKFDVL
jgi:hypothetical protein